MPYTHYEAPVLDMVCCIIKDIGYGMLYQRQSISYRQFQCFGLSAILTGWRAKVFLRTIFKERSHI